MTSRGIKEILPSVLRRLENEFELSHNLILSAWPDIIGGKLAAMTTAISFENGVLRVKVTNSTLLSLLKEHEKDKLLASLRQQFPKFTIKTILFFLG